MLVHRRDGKTNLYRPVYTRREYIEMRARTELESVVDQYGEVALAHIARQMAALDPKRRRALQRIAQEK
jgi:predicted transcriptional regulator